MSVSIQFRKQKSIKNFLVLLFLTKPTVDLLWGYSVSFLGFTVSPLHVAGLLVFLYLSFLLLISPKQKAPFFKLMILFVALNFVSAVFGFMLHDRFEIQGILNMFFRVMDSVVIYGAAFALGLRDEDTDWDDIIKAIVVGVSIAILLNQIAILAGYSGGIKANAASVHSSLRERGLYYDPGGLAIVALYGFIFISYALKNVKLGFFRFSLAVAAILSSFYLMLAGLSRSVFILLAFYAVFNFVIFGKAKEKALYIVVIGVLGVLIASYSLVNYERLTARFQGDIGAVESIASDFATGKDISTNDLEALGSNRGRNWIVSINWIAQRGPMELMFGNFMSTPAHSDYIDILSRNGILGFTLYLMILLSFLFTIFKARSSSSHREYYPLHVFAFLLIAVYLLYSIPFRPLSYTTTAWYMWTAVGFSMARIRLVALDRRAQIRKTSFGLQSPGARRSKPNTLSP
jgi:hypothetical protein